MPNQSISSRYQVKYGKDFLKDLTRIIEGGDKTIKRRVEKLIEKLKVEPHKKKSGIDIRLISTRKEGVYRVRIGKYRMVHEINENEKKIEVTMIFPRGRDY